MVIQNRAKVEVTGRITCRLSFSPWQRWILESRAAHRLMRTGVDRRTNFIYSGTFGTNHFLAASSRRYIYAVIISIRSRFVSKAISLTRENSRETVA